MQAAITNVVLRAVKVVKSAACLRKTFFSPSQNLNSNRIFVPVVQKIGPAQLLTKVSTPTATKLKSLMPLYALDKSTDEMALVPP